MALFDTLAVKPYRNRVNNWSNTLACYPELIFEPTSAREVQLIVNEARRQGRRIRPVGEHASPGKAFMAGMNDVHDSFSLKFVGAVRADFNVRSG